MGTKETGVTEVQLHKLKVIVTVIDVLLQVKKWITEGFYNV